MTFTMLLKSQGLLQEQIAAILLSMKKNRIFITKEEKIDDRYHKLKQQKNEMKIKLDHAELTIARLQSAAAENDELKRTLKGYKENIAAFTSICKSLFPEQFTDQSLIPSIERMNM